MPVWYVTEFVAGYCTLEEIKGMTSENKVECPISSLSSYHVQLKGINPSF